jgi:DNA uptake protein ComE-like DNA-binding protein
VKLIYLIQRFLVALLEEPEKNKRRHEQIMTALETLTDAVNRNTQGQAALTSAVNDAIIHIGSPGVTDAQLLSLATAIDANTASDADLTKKLAEALNPAPPA